MGVDRVENWCGRSGRFVMTERIEPKMEEMGSPRDWLLLGNRVSACSGKFWGSVPSKQRLTWASGVCDWTEIEIRQGCHQNERNNSRFSYSSLPLC